ncbi:IS3 family transposase [Tissierella carlieri]
MSYYIKNNIEKYIYFYNYERFLKRLNSLNPIEYRTRAV